MRFAVIGAGGVGAFFGAMLAAAGNDVMFTARESHLDAIRREWLRMTSPGRSLRVPPERCVGSPAQIGPVDTVFFCVKSHPTERAILALLPLLGPSTVIISLQTGVANEATLNRALPECVVFGGVAYIYSTITRPGEITVASGPSRIVFGPFEGAPSDERRRAEQIRDVCTHEGITAEVPDDIVATLWVYAALLPYHLHNSESTR